MGQNCGMPLAMAESEADLRRIAGVLLQLRTQFDEDSLVAQIQEQQAEGYRVAYVESVDGDGPGEVLCVAGFVVATKLAWGRHIYVDDLVTDTRRRSRGAGKVLIDWLRDHGRELGCRELHLDSGVQRFAAHRFYLREGFHIASHHFSILDLG